ncbi:MAG: ester cyclase, partial [Pseudomonadota bacterium]
CETYYTDDCLIHTLGGDVTGSEAVTQNTRATMQAFPDRRLEPLNVIWSDDGPAGFYSSHLSLSPMTNLGPSEFGPATGRKAHIYTIADCMCRENKIYLEWLVRDTAGLVQQLGLDADDVARKQALGDHAAGTSLLETHAARRQALDDAQGPIPTGLGLDPSAVIAAVWRAEPDLSVHYFDRCTVVYPGTRPCHTRTDIAAHIADMFIAFPDLKVRVAHVCSVPYLDDGQDIAVRLAMAGTHTGDGVYGPASGASVYIMAACHWRVIHGRIHQEWMVWDDLAVRRQVWTARLAA